MNKPQTPEEILKGKTYEVYDGLNNWGSNTNEVLSKKDAIEAIKEAQRQAVQYALEKAAENAKIKYFTPNTGILSKESILSLESQILKDLGHE